MNTAHFPEILVLENSKLRLEIPSQVGPRILSLQFLGGPNLLAVLPNFVIKRPDGETYRIYGGHRLWISPEDSLRSYALDDLPVEVVREGNNLLVRKPVEPETGIKKSLCLCMAGEEARVTITHHIENQGSKPVRTAPWAITQLRLGGVAMLPQAITATALLPNRVLALWPYTNMASPHVTWGKNCTLLRAEKQTPFKIGLSNPRGWIGYWLEGTLFVKRAGYEAQAEYPDYGCSSECYCNDEFIELETLGPLQTLQPGETAKHVETWEIYGSVEAPVDEKTAQAIMDRLGLE